MRRETLLDFFSDFSAIDRLFLVHDDGYRVREYTYARIAGLAHAFAARLRHAGLANGDAIVIWSENRPEWIVAFWGALLEGIVVVPIDFRASSEFLWRVAEKTDARLLLVGNDIKVAGTKAGVHVWPIGELTAAGTSERKPANPGIRSDSTAEIIFTSGATAEPKGVVITHGNVLANIVPIEREVVKYLARAKPVLPILFPIRFLNLLPLSHMFGQAMATFIPPMLPGVVIFSHSYNPQQIAGQIRSRRVSVLVCVPKVLEVMKEYMARTVPGAAEPSAEPMHWLKRWWLYRRAHRLFGWKFWAFVVGAAPLDPGLEEYWRRLGFAVIQGYGLTETAPIVTLNHPFKSKHGTVGAPIAGVEVRIAPDGEILVRGANVTTGYYNAPRETAEAFEDGWLHTGDIGALDESGRLTIRGRKKEMIVTPEGLNVFPEDVERVVDAQPGVIESAVVGVGTNGTEERPHAVMVVEPQADSDEIVRRANALLEEHQRIRSFSLWPEAALPRTEGTGKLKRREVRQWVVGGARAASAAAGASVLAVVSRFARQRAVTPQTSTEELGLSSLERVELMMALEDAFDTSIDEIAFSEAKTVSELERLIASASTPADAASGVGTPAIPSRVPDAAALTFPRWNRGRLARTVRRVSLPTWILPLGRLFAWTRVEGLEHLEGLREPVIFAANHQSHMDTPVIMWALPSRWRYSVAPAMAKEFFKAHFYPAQHTHAQRLTNGLNYYLASLFFNAFPLPQREAGARQTLRYVGELIGDGYSILIFPEGRRSEDGSIDRFLPGVAMMASRLAVPVVPVRIDGVDKVLNLRWKFPQPGPVRVAFGEPMRLTGEDYPALAHQIEQRVRDL
jgi:long-chain acyl-CoA synthetase